MGKPNVLTIFKVFIMVRNIKVSMIYTKLFEEHDDYVEYIGSGDAVLPNVSCCEDTPNEVYYNPTVDPYNGHDYVDLGLPSGTKWATMNVGAASVTGYGDLFQYGKGADKYSVTHSQASYDGVEDPLAASADTASVVMGGAWHMPTQEQVRELTANTTSAWVTTYEGVSITGAKFTSKTNGNVLFIPLAGNYAPSGFFDDENAMIWASNPNGSTNAYSVTFKKNSWDVGGKSREYGCSVRGVVG